MLMRVSFFLFILLSGFIAQAQTNFDYLSCQKVLTEKVKAIQLKIWNGVMDGELTPYRTGSLRTVLSLFEIRENCKGLDTFDYQEHVFRCTFSKNHKHDRQIKKLDKLNDKDLKLDPWGDSSNDIIEVDSSWNDFYDEKNRPIDSAIRARRELEEHTEDSLFNIKYVCADRIDFDATRDITGMSFGYTRSIDPKVWSNTFRCTSISILTDYLFGEGFVLHDEPIFHIRIDQLNAVLSDAEIEFVRALNFQAKNLGDFLPNKCVLYDELGLQALDRENNAVRFDNDHRTTFVQAREIALLSKYNSDVFFETVNYLLKEDGPLDYKAYLFKDISLIKPWKGLLSELNSDEAIEYISEPSDPYNLVIKMWRGIGYPIFTIDQSTLHISKSSETDYLVSVANEVHRIEDFTKKEYEKQIDIYFSYSSIKHLLQPHDRIVLEALLQEITQ